MKVYCPMPHHILKKHWRVPMWHIDGSYVVCVDKNYTRKFTDETLPIFIKMKLPFMKTASHILDEDPDDIPLDEYREKEPDFYICEDDQKDLENIGWRVSKRLYVIVLHETDLDSLRGERLTKDTHDTRSKSKKESKTNSRRPKVLSFLTSNWRIWEKWRS